MVPGNARDAGRERVMRYYLYMGAGHHGPGEVWPFGFARSLDAAIERADRKVAQYVRAMRAHGGASCTVQVRSEAHTWADCLSTGALYTARA